MADETVVAEQGKQMSDNKQCKVWNLDIGDQVREEELDGRHYLVVPMTMILEGVHTGSQGPVYYSIDELAKTPKMWNMKPVLIEHPFRGDTATDLEVYKKQAVGMIMNTHFENGRLKAEAWIDKDLASKKYPDLLDHIRYRLPMEVSTGLFSELILEPGTWQGEEYKGRIVNIRADHLAILPHKQGACSLADGAGLLINQSFASPVVGDEEEKPKRSLNIISTIINQDYVAGSYVVDSLGEDEAASAVLQKPRLTNTETTEGPVESGIDGGPVAQVIEIPTDLGPLKVTLELPKLNIQSLDGSAQPISELADDELKKEDDDTIELPEKEPMEDNATILTPEEVAAEEAEDEETGEKDQYMELRDRLDNLRKIITSINRRNAVKNKCGGCLKKKFRVRSKRKKGKGC